MRLNTIGRIFSRKNVVKALVWMALPLSFFVVSCKDSDSSEDTIEEIRANKEKGETYLQWIENQSGVKKDPSGLLYKPVVSTTNTKPGARDTVCIHYNGFQTNGSQFIAKSDTIAMEDLEKGLYIGLRHMGEGSTYNLYVPYYLMYGTSKATTVYDGNSITITEYSALMYEMRLDSIIFVK